MSNRNCKFLSRGRTFIVLVVPGLLSLPFLLFASGGPATEKITVFDKVSAKTEAISGPEHQRKQTRTVESEVITITPRGFEPTEITRPQGEFILTIENPNRQDLNLTLARESGASQHQVRTTRDEPNWNELENLPPGRYVLTEERHPEWSCVITITVR